MAAKNREMDARFAGTCKACGEKFEAGTRILWNTGTKATTHAVCEKFAAAEETLSVSERYDYGNVAEALMIAQEMGDEAEVARCCEIMEILSEEALAEAERSEV